MKLRFKSEKEIDVIVNILPGKRRKKMKMKMKKNDDQR